jgi:hypothetical protein
MKVRKKQRCVLDFLYARKIAPVDTHRRLLNVYGDQTVDVSTVRRWLLGFSSGGSDVRDRPVRVRVRVTLQLTVSQSVCLGVEPNLGLLTRDIIIIFFF